MSKGQNTEAKRKAIQKTAECSSSAALETFTDEQVTCALGQWLEYGEKSYIPNHKFSDKGHAGYFSGVGWAARCLRYHLAKRVSGEAVGGEKGPDPPLKKCGKCGAIWGRDPGSHHHCKRSRQ